MVLLGLPRMLRHPRVGFSSTEGAEEVMAVESPSLRDAPLMGVDMESSLYRAYKPL